MKNRLPLLLYAVLFFLSGAAGLIYEIVWERLLELYFGVTLTAITLIVAAYMGGLGVGSLIGGQAAQRARKPALLYGAVEVGIGLFGLASPFLIHWIGQRTAGAPYALVFLLSFGLLMIPTILMGMTLPLLTQTFVRRVENTGRTIGLLYGINTLGAAFGALLAAYVLVGLAGFYGAILAGVGLNLVAGAGALWFGWQARASVEAQGQTQPAASVPQIALKYQVILLSAFLVGFIDMGLEMAWFRVIGILNKNTAYGFPSVLAVFLVGLALGGWLWGSKADKSKDAVALFWKLQLGVGITVGLSFLALWGALHVPAFEAWFERVLSRPQMPIPPYLKIGSDFVFSRRLMATGLFEYFLPILLLVLPGSLLMGGGLPVLDRIAIRSAEQSGRRVGDIHLANILGSVIGTLAPDYLFLPLLGSELTVKLLTLLTLVFTLLVLSHLSAVRHRIVYGLPVTLLVLAAALPGRGQLYTRLYEVGTGLESVVDESGDSVLVLNFHASSRQVAQLWIGGIQNSYFPSNGEYERSAMTCASANHPRRVLLIGLGGGNTAYFLTQLPGVEEIVIVELMEDLGTFLDEHAPVAQATLHDPKVTYLVDDGRRYLYANPEERFDMIFIDPLNSFTAGHNNLYSREAMTLYRSHLQEDGIFCGWINEAHVLPTTVASVFPFVEQFRDFVVAGNRPFEYDRDYMQAAGENFLSAGNAIIGPGAAETLAPETVLALRVRDEQAIKKREGEIPVLTDMNPWLEYYYFHKRIR